MTEERSEEMTMQAPVFVAAVKGDASILESTNIAQIGKDNLLAKTPELKNNIVHVAARNGRYKFIEAAIAEFPDLLQQKNKFGNTPLHEAAELGNKETINLLVSLLKITFTSTSCDESTDIPSYMEKNKDGNTAFHLALRSHNLVAADELFRIVVVDHPKILAAKNDYGISPLHHFIVCCAGNGGVSSLNLEQDHKQQLFDRLIRTYPPAVHVQDSKGVTPHIRAARCGLFMEVYQILFYYPELSECRDNEDGSVLHNLRLKEADLNARDKDACLWAYDAILSLPGTPNLIFSRDKDGNTPLHRAIANREFDVAQLILQRCVKDESIQRKKLLENIKNAYAKTVSDLVNSTSGIPANLKKLIKWTPEGSIMDKQLYEAATKGDTHIFQRRRSQVNYEIEASYANDTYDDDYFQRQAEDGSNIIHIALRYGHKSFIDRALNSFFDLVYQKDSKGDTPLHVAARLHTPAAIEFLASSLTIWRRMDIDYRTRSFQPKLWTVRNSKGNTFLHEAARFCNYAPISLLPVGHIHTTDVNDNGETILHVIVRFATYTAKDLLQNVTELVESRVYLRDAEGFTPVLRAVQCGRLGVARLLVRQYPQSIEIPDNKGRTVLHHMKSLVFDLVDDIKDIVPVWVDFFELPGINDLRISQDDCGNTPLHSSIVDSHFTKAKFLMEMCLRSNNKRELDIVNNDGESVFDLLSSRPHLPTMNKLQQLVNRNYVKEREFITEMMDDDVYQAAIDGNVQIFSNNQTKGNDQKMVHDGNKESNLAPLESDLESGSRKPKEGRFSRLTPGGSNIIHIALRHGKLNTEEFVKTSLEHLPVLSTQPDSNGDTPLHLAAKWKSGVSSVQLLIQASKSYLETLDESRNFFHVAPWAMKNYKGSFPIHEALQNNNLIVARALLECDNEAASRVNDLGETPLHAFAKNGFSVGDEEANQFVKELIKKDKEAAYIRDDEGLIPLLRAARSGRFEVARAILKQCPQSSYLRDPKGRTFLHLLRFTGEDVDESVAGTFKSTGKQLFGFPEADAQRFLQDYEGNTPLHYAIKTQNSIAAIVLARRCLEDDERKELGLIDKEGQTIPDLLASHEVPNEIIELIRKKVPQAVYLARSSFGIRKTEMKDTANALSVVAALLTTITFAAGLQVPGGFDNDDGSPVLLTHQVFTAFIVANTIAMCCSMLCLFLLLWVMGIGKIHGSLMVLDISIMLLRFSFYLTLLSFTLGMFAITVKKSLWLAILLCGLSFLTILLTFKFSIKFVAKYGGRFVNAISDFKVLVFES